MKTIEIIEMADNTFEIHEYEGENICPTTCKKTAIETVARVAQLLGIKEPVIPQSYPERVCIGEIE